MEIVVNIVLPVFGVVVLGYVASKLGWFGAEAERGLGQFVFNFAVPLLLLRSIGTADLPESVPWGYFLSFYLSVGICYAMGMLLARYVFKRHYGGQVITGFGYGFGNNVLLGLPLIFTAIGDKAAVPFFIILSVHGLILFTTTTLLLELERNKDGQKIGAFVRQVGKSLITNPILLGIYAGLILNLTDIGVPGPLDPITELIGRAVTPCALFSLGASLTKYGIAGRIGQSAVMVICKLILLPLMVYGFATYVFDVDPFWRMIAVLMAAQPSGVMVYIFAQRYGTGQAIATTSIFLSTTASIVTLSVILYMFHLG
ncbi:AEC family transporter [Aestuariispira ectoiniformans]|uniref:AEC family transporter n=1 Tax=Aestuariispira ectoiniformans TaxID=2775080 RepID=UPI00223C2270|nr:AEC family transporter [Aestuariispira ectoiniformans]